MTQDPGWRAGRSLGVACAALLLLFVAPGLAFAGPRHGGGHGWASGRSFQGGHGPAHHGRSRFVVRSRHRHERHFSRSAGRIRYGTIRSGRFDHRIGHRRGYRHRRDPRHHRYDARSGFVIVIED